jgi:hypothetical protein
LRPTFCAPIVVWWLLDRPVKRGDDSENTSNLKAIAEIVSIPVPGLWKIWAADLSIGGNKSLTHHNIG